ncbi:hypothetical protein VNO77_01674 [Canavalia gladiata]|uniref:Uncharacterized protein n=1 Tax=Canavalia gladiata TaxID=3824 RepID=A0AAN9MTJ8_CANGL
MRDTCKGLFFTQAFGMNPKLHVSSTPFYLMGHKGQLSLFFLKRVKHVTCKVPLNMEHMQEDNIELTTLAQIES